MTGGYWLPLTAVIPFLFALTGWWALPRRYLAALLPLAALPALVAACWLPIDSAWVLPRGRIELSWLLDDTARAFLFFTALGWTLAGFFAAFAFRGHPRRSAFAFPFLVAMGGNYLLVSAADVVTFYTGFAIMGFASWGLVIFDQTPQAFRAGRIYLALVVFGEALVFPGLVKGALWAQSIRLNDIHHFWTLDPSPRWMLVLLFLGFGVKAGIAPAHFWLPVAHPAAPTAASAVLSGCMIKAGVLGWLRVLPLGDLPMPFLGQLALALGGLSLLGGSLVGLTQSNAKAVLAYSSIQKCGVLLLLLCPAMLDPTLWPLSLAAVTGYAGFHALHKTALFLGVSVTPGVVSVAGRCVVWILLTALTLSFAGAPGTAGGWVKEPAKALGASLPDPFGGWFSLLLLLAGPLTLLLGARYVLLVRPVAHAAAPKRGTWSVWVVSCLLALSLPLVGAEWGVNVELAWKEIVALGAALLGILLWFEFRWSLPVRIPQGDLLAWLERIWLAGSRRREWFLMRTERFLVHGGGGVALALLILLLLNLMWAWRG
jgi:formate hydrogenlyase subunit 3/multisubunit Na+/H+ antiporter MnhD subunit